MEELVSSNTAKIRGIKNTPDATIASKLIRLATEILQPVRDKWGAPLYITSGYRCPQLNKAVGGVTTSQHLVGEAADIISGQGKAVNKKLFELMRDMMKKGEITVGQLINEKGDSWIHVSLPNKTHKNQLLYIK